MALTPEELAELQALESKFGGNSQPAIIASQNTSRLSPEEQQEFESLDAIYGNRNSPVLDYGKQFASGAVEGMTKLFDLGKTAGAYLTGQGFDPYNEYNNFSLTDTVQPYLAEKPKEYSLQDYTRTAGEFVAPGGLLNKAFKIPLAIGAVSDLLASIGSKGLEEITGDKTIAPIVGAVAAGSLPMLGAGLKRALLGKPADQITDIAAQTLKEQTKIQPDILDAKILESAKDPLGKFKTTAELTDSPLMAQIQQQTTSTGEGAINLGNRIAARNKARDELLNSTTNAQTLNPEALADTLRGQAADYSNELQTQAGKLWESVPRDIDMDIGKSQRSINNLVSKLRGKGTRGLHSSLRKIIDDFNNVQNVDSNSIALYDQFGALINKEKPPAQLQKSGVLQKIRSEALEISRSPSLADRAKDKAIAVKLADEIDVIMRKNLDPSSYENWKNARNITRTEAEIFNRSTVGGKLLDDNILDQNLLSKAFRGDAKSVRQLRLAINNDAKTLEQVKRGVLDSIPRDVQGVITPKSAIDFYRKNSEGLTALFGRDHAKKFELVAKDLQSEAKVSKLAYAASQGNSITAQSMRTAAYLKNVVLNKLPGSGVLTKWIADSALREAKQIDAVLLQAALDPKIASDLLKRPTTKSINKVVNYIKKMGLVSASNSLDSQELQGATLDRNSILPNDPRGSGLSENSDLDYRSQGVGDSKQMQELPPIQEQSNISYPDFNPEIEPNQAQINPQINQVISKLEPLAQAMIKVESAGNPNAVSKAGAIGLMQVMPFWQDKLNLDLNDPMQNIEAGITIYNQELERYQDPVLALAAYNAGSPAVDRAIKKAGSTQWSKVKRFLPKETVLYIPKVLSAYREINTMG